MKRYQDFGIQVQFNGGKTFVLLEFTTEAVKFAKFGWKQLNRHNVLQAPIFARIDRMDTLLLSD